jgi:hypothetical protein
MYQLTLIVNLILLFTLELHATEIGEFNHLKLGELLSERAKLVNERDDFNDITPLGVQKLAARSPRFLADNDRALARALKIEINGDDFSHMRINQNQLSKSNQTLSSENNYYSLIYQSIIGLLAEQYQKLGQDLSLNILNHRQNFNLGQYNFSGISWQKPMGVYTLSINRQLRPNPSNPETWLVIDQLSFSIDAESFLKRLIQDGLVALSNIGVEAFAGIQFKREYQVIHQAQSYEAGLTSDYQKLFLPFLFLEKNRLISLAPYSLVSKKDFLTFSTGISVETPPVYGASLKGGLFTEVNRLTSVSAQILGKEDNPSDHEFLRLSSEKKLSVATGIQASLQLDFFKLIKLTLLSFELEYEFSSTNQVHLSFNHYDKDKLVNQPEISREFNQLLNLSKFQFNYLEPFIESLEQRESKNLTSKYSALIYGKLKKSQTESVVIIKNNQFNQFFREVSSNIQVVQSWLSRLWSSAIYRIFKFENTVKNTAVEEFNYELEYNADRMQNTNQINTEDLSLKLNHELILTKTTGLSKRYKKRAIATIESSTLFDQKIIEQINLNKIKAPLSIQSQLIINKKGLDYFHQQNPNNLFKVILKVCNNNNPKWLNEKKRQKALKSIQLGKDLCVKKLGNNTLDYLSDFHQTKKVKLKALNKLIKSIFAKAKSNLIMHQLFGINSSFIHGNLIARSYDNQAFTTYFKRGTFDGLGVISEFNRFNDRSLLVLE